MSRAGVNGRPPIEVLNSKQPRVNANRDQGIYIGRAWAGYAESPWHNPYRRQSAQRSNAIDLFRLYLLEHPELVVQLAQEMDRRRRYKLICWCAPEPCHGDVLADAVTAYWLQHPEYLPAAQSAAPASETSPTIRALSLYEPWAALIIYGEKRYETRSWDTDYRGWLAIHASKTFSAEERWLTTQEPFRSALQRGAERGFWLPEALPLGAVIGLARLVDCVPTIGGGIDYGRMPDQEYEFGNFGPDRYAWRFAEVRPIKPQVVSGSQYLWGWRPVQPIEDFTPTPSSPQAGPVPAAKLRRETLAHHEHRWQTWGNGPYQRCTYPRCVERRRLVEEDVPSHA